MASTISPNRALARVMVEGGVSNKRLAFEVRARARADGVDLSTDHNAVRRWLDGKQPKPDAAGYVAAVLSDHLGRAVTPAMLGFTAHGTAAASAPVGAGDVEYLADPLDATEALGALAAQDVSDEHPDTLRRWDQHAAPAVISGFLFDAPRGAFPASDGEPVDATAIRRMTAHLTSMDFELGGGHTRQLLLSFLRGQVLPVLHGLSSNHARADIYSATAELAQMLGWSAYDSGRHGAAQRYLVHGLRLAREAGDHHLGAFLFSSLSHQANYLGHFRDAVQLARAGQHEASAGGSPTVESMLFAYEARALASLGDDGGCARALHRAEQAFDASRPTNDPEWLDFYDAAELAGEAAHCFRDLQSPGSARQFCADAIASPTTPARTRGFIGLVTAMTALHAGELDEAVSVATESVSLAGPLDSGRYRRYVSDFVHATTARHPGDARVSEFVALTAPMLTDRTGR